MPLPTPRLSGDSKESEKEFVSRCAGSDIMNEEYPDVSQRAAVCYSIYRRAKKKQRAKGSDTDPTWDEASAEIQKTGAIVTEDTAHLIHPPSPTTP